MISRLQGTVLDIGVRNAVVDVGGVGYAIAATAHTLSTLKTGREAALWTYLAVREDALDLYGFSDKEQLAFFKMLITVSGIGPKTALGILDAASIASLRNAIISGNTAPLTKISGLGSKVADKIVLELKGKVGTEMSSAASGEIEAIEALKALGYTHKDARESLQDLPAELSVSDRIKAALKMLGK